MGRVRSSNHTEISPASPLNSTQQRRLVIDAAWRVYVRAQIKPCLTRSSPWNGHALDVRWRADCTGFGVEVVLASLSGLSVLSVLTVLLVNADTPVENAAFLDWATGMA